MQSFLSKVPKFFKSKWTLGVMILIILGVGGYFLFHKNPTYQFVTVQNGSITESVSLTGNTIPNQNVSLAFGSSGIVSHTYSDLGKQVNKGQVLVELNMSDLLAQLHNAQANYQKIINGATGPTIDVTKASVSAAEVSLDGIIKQQKLLVQNAYNNLLNSTPEALPSGGESDYTAPTISGNYSKGIEGKITVSIYYTGNGVSFSVGGIASGGGIVTTTTPQPIGDSGLYIKFPSTTSSNVTEWVINIPNKKASDYLTNYNAYQVALENQNQTVKNAQASLDEANASLAALLTPARSEDIAQAQADVDSIIAKIQNAKIIAPISGVITQFDAKVGQFASSSVPLVSIISSGGYEVDSGVSETDIGKISIGNKVSMTLDAFPNEIFTGTVFYIAPSETNVQGVVDYQVKISFDKSDLRLKSGLTANIDIQTKHKDNILVLPQYAILQNDQGTFVETLENKVIKQNPVILGIADQKGNVEIISGVTLGEQVLNIGLKAQ